MLYKIFSINGWILIWVLAVFLTACTAIFDREFDKSKLSPDEELANDPDSYPNDGDLDSTNSEESRENWCGPLYSDSSIWNLPIDWSIAQIHSDSDRMMNAFFGSSDWIGTNVDSYAPNIYLVTNETPQRPVKLREYRFRDAYNDKYIIYGQPAEIVWMPIPADAHPADGTDAQLAIINIDSGEEWGLNGGEIDVSGEWYADGAYRYHIENSGIPPEGFGQRGVGIGQIAGIVRPCEIERGKIEHAVTIAYDYPCAPRICQLNGWPEVIPPFTKTDGRGKSFSDIPEGARMVVRPEITLKDIQEACHDMKGCIAWITNMQVFGGFIVDRSGHPKTYGEGMLSANWNYEYWTNNMLKDIPQDWYSILDWDTVATNAP